MGYSSDAGYSFTVFEPIDEYKGDMARAYFYMSTRYYSEDGGWASTGATNKSTILPWQVNVLLAWHQLDTVSAKEIARNDTIYYSYQNNRNPFIDNPQWVDSIWQITDFTSVSETGLSQNFSIYPNPATNVLFIKDFLNTLSTTYEIYNLFGQLMVSGFLEDGPIEIASLNAGIYFIHIGTGKENYSRKFIKQ